MKKTLSIVKRFILPISILFVLILIGFIYTCNKFEPYSSNNTETKVPTISKKDLPQNVAVYVSYEAETMKVSEIVNDKNAFKGSDNLNQLAKIPMIDKISYETFIYKDGNFKTTINVIEPKQKIQSIISLSPPNKDKELEPASKFEITPTKMTAYHKDGSIKFKQDVNLPNYKTMLQKMLMPCYKNNLKANLSNVGIFNVDASVYLSECYKEEIAKLNGSIKLSEDGKFTIIRKPLLDAEMKAYFQNNQQAKGKISGLKSSFKTKDIASIKNNLATIYCKAICQSNIKTNIAQRLSLYLQEYKKLSNKKLLSIHYGKKIAPEKNIFLVVNDDPDANKRKDNIKRALEGNNPNNFDDITIIDNEHKKVVGKAIYEGEEKMIMSQRYKLKDNSNEVMVVNNEYYVIDPVTNTDRTDIIQTTYENVNIVNNLD